MSVRFLQGIFRRGMQLEALKEFILSQGASKNVTLQEWDKIWSINKRIIDPLCPRHTAVAASQRVRLHLAGAPSPSEVVEVDRHKKNPSLGKKKTTLSQVSAAEVLTDIAVALIANSVDVLP